jgi:hypothetical protein
MGGKSAGRGAPPIRTALIGLFKRICPRTPRITADTDVRSLCGFGRASWRALADDINALPALVAAGVVLSRIALAPCRSVRDIESVLAPRPARAKKPIRRRTGDGASTRTKKAAKMRKRRVKKKSSGGGGRYHAWKDLGRVPPPPPDGGASESRYANACLLAPAGREPLPTHHSLAPSEIVRLCLDIGPLSRESQVENPQALPAIAQGVAELDVMVSSTDFLVGAESVADSPGGSVAHGRFLLPADGGRGRRPDGGKYLITCLSG